MINKITKILFAVTAFAVNLAAQEAITFSDFIAEDGSGIEKLLKLQKERGDKKEVFRCCPLPANTLRKS